MILIVKGKSKVLTGNPPPGDLDSLERREGRAGVEGGC